MCIIFTFVIVGRKEGFIRGSTGLSCVCTFVHIGEEMGCGLWAV